ncbi:hypothetical protein RF11_07158 [Thelohanellus kitauei]|uniref:Uncharacterized protein n=1 Tax=Thelohanellus kitauei TaxID=669202 RepID=A0A0C2MUT4_THEKT|nr:hypothetical protein RF11_07158 [Thelohanellus kitauei]
MKVDAKATDLIIKFEKVDFIEFNQFLEIKCNLVDTTEYIEINKCNISAQINIRNKQHDYSFKDEWKFKKNTKYEIENLEKTFNIDPSVPKEIIFYITNISIEPQSYTRICTLKQKELIVNENDFTCVNISQNVDTTNTNLTITPINQDILDENISKINKLWWSLIILIVPVIIICAMYIL